MTLEEQLINVQEAITKAEQMEEYEIKDRRMKYANLDALYKRESMLLSRIQRRDAAIYGNRAWRIAKYED